MIRFYSGIKKELDKLGLTELGQETEEEEASYPKKYKIIDEEEPLNKSLESLKVEFPNGLSISLGSSRLCMMELVEIHNKIILAFNAHELAVKGKEELLQINPLLI